MKFLRYPVFVLAAAALYGALGGALGGIVSVATGGKDVSIVIVAVSMGAIITALAGIFVGAVVGVGLLGNNTTKEFWEKNLKVTIFSS
jgi:hypothetical protein